MSEIVRLFDVPVFEMLEDKKKKKILSIQTDIDLELINIKNSVYNIGRLLYRAKSIIPHGMFQKWIEETWRNELPYSTAASFKAIYEKFKNNPQTVRLLPVTMLIQMKQEAFPDEIFKLVNENPEAFCNADIPEFVQAYDDFKEGKITLDGWEILARRQIEIGFAIHEGNHRLIHTLRTKRTIKQSFIQLKKVISTMRRHSVKMRQFFPATENLNEWSDGRGEVGKHNRMVGIIDESLDDDLLNDIDVVIRELNYLKNDIESRELRLVRRRLVEENGIVRKKALDNNTNKIS